MLAKDRDSFWVHLGRIYQAISPRLLQLLDTPLWFFARKAQPPQMVVLVASPRSGSTLTYQVMLHALDSYYLSNLWNLFYATPVLGGMISRKLCSKHRSNFRSSHGFVPGLCGPAEGLKFWSYWFSQDLVDRGDLFPPMYVEKFVRVLGFFSGQENTPFIAGYLGHVFCMDMLRQCFPNVVFVCLYRDLLSTAYSIFEIRRHSKTNWFSVRPRECIDVNNLTLHEQVARQVYFIYRRIEEQSGQDTYFITYEKLCASPNRFIDGLIQFSESRGLQLRRRDDTSLPKKFDFRLIEPELDEHAQELSINLRDLEYMYGPLHYYDNAFYSLLRRSVG